MRQARSAAAPHAAARLYAGEQLQRLLVATIDLGLIVNQAHWNVHGRGSHALQLLFDDLSEALAGHRHLLARRAAELGVAPDRRAYTVATESRLAQLADGPLPASDAAAAVADRLDRVADLAGQQLAALGASDCETRHVLTGLSQLVAQHRLALRLEISHAPARPARLTYYESAPVSYSTGLLDRTLETTCR
jgi:starvation-inducible DNA-binding protein